MRTLALVCGLLALGGCFNGSLERRYAAGEHKNVSAVGATTLHVENVAGHVRIEATNGRDVDVAVMKRASSPEGLKNIHIAVTKSGDTVSIISSTTGELVVNSNIDLTIKAPSSLALDVSNTAGAARIIGFTRDVRVHSQAGTIDVELAKLGDGQQVDLVGTVGTVALTIPRRSDATIAAHSTVGSFHSDFPSLSSARENVVGESGGGTIGNGSAKVTLSATTGSIDINAR